MTYLLEIVLEDIKSRREFKSWGEDVNSIDNFELYRVMWHQVSIEIR